MKVLKFGGTSVGSFQNISAIKDIVSKESDHLVVVFSAIGGVTNKLEEASVLAVLGNERYKEILSEIENKHFEYIEALVKPKERTQLFAKVKMMLNELSDILRGLFLIRETTLKIQDNVLSYGERLSCAILHHVVEGSIHLDPRELIFAERSNKKAVVDYELTYDKIRSAGIENNKLTIVPGFIASTKRGELITLGRGGSDFTAALFAAALDADILEIWTDVDGFMTADPRVISSAHTIKNLSYSEAMELSHFGAKVIYPPTILPVYHKGIPIRIKNTFNPKAQGTLISEDREFIKPETIKGISSIGSISLITLQGIGMVGVTGITKRLFGALADKEINVILISQASSENSVSFAVSSEDELEAYAAVKGEFVSEIDRGIVNNVSVEGDLAIVAIVGENMKHTPGISGKLFRSLGVAGINIIAIAQGASELNISFVVKSKQIRKTLNTIHQEFFLSKYIDIKLYLVGIGTVGSKLLNQIKEQSEKLKDNLGLKVTIAGVANSRKMIFDTDGVSPDITREKLLEIGEDANIRDFVIKMIDQNYANAVFVDCTASEEVSVHYKDILEANISVVTANKIATSSDFQQYKDLKLMAKSKGVKFLYETNVGAGLPIIAPINDLMRSGDKILKIQAVLSGTLNYICDTVSVENTISKTIKMAKESGYSEPDPRIDLSGVDVLRKIIILARESGYQVESDEVDIQPFIPQKYFETDTVDEFLEKTKELDVEFENERKQLEAKNKKWRYVADLNEGKLKVSLQSVGKEHPFYDLEGSNNIVLITTERYKNHPMQIKGYGAGADVTAAGVFADIIKVSNI